MNVLDKFKKFLTIDDVWNIVEQPEVWLNDVLRDEEGCIIELLAWLPEEEFPTARYLLSFMREDEVKERFGLYHQLMFALKYYGTRFAPRVFKYITEQVRKIIEKW